MAMAMLVIPGGHFNMMVAELEDVVRSEKVKPRS